MGMSRQELFEKAKVARKKEIKEQETKKNGPGSYDYNDVVYTALSIEKPKIFRIYGLPDMIRQKPTDPKRILVSSVLGDNNKKFRCIWPNLEENQNWILWRVYNTVMAFEWSKDKNENGYKYRIYKNAKTHPECYRRVAKNNSENQFESGWYPKRLEVANVIDRHDLEFHEENKHSKLISRKASPIKDTDKFFYDPGVPTSIFNTIYDDKVEYFGDWENYDVVVEKLKADPWYKVYIENNDSQILEAKLGSDFELIKVGPMTEEEKNYELYDLDTIFKVTSYTKIMSRLGQFIKKVDVDFGTNYYSELEDLAAKEKAERETQAKDAKEVKAPKEETIVTPKEEPKSNSTKVRERVVKNEKPTTNIPWEKLADGTFNGTKYLGIPEMTDDEKACVVKVNDDGSFTYVKNEYEVMLSTTSNFESPENFHVDPLNGDIF